MPDNIDRTSIECQLVVRELVRTILSERLAIGLRDSDGETLLERSLLFNTVRMHLCACDMEYVDVYTAGKIGMRLGRVLLVYENGADVISDYSTGIEALVQPALDVSTSLVRR